MNFRSMNGIIPTKLAGLFDREEYQKSMLYNRTKSRFGAMSSTFSFLILLTVLGTGFLGWLNGLLAAHIADPTWLALAFFGVVFIGSDLLSLPFDWYNTFVIEEKFGFNKMKPAMFVMDKIKGYVLTAILGGGILYLLLWLIQSMGDNF